MLHDYGYQGADTGDYYATGLDRQMQHQEYSKDGVRPTTNEFTLSRRPAGANIPEVRDDYIPTNPWVDGVNVRVGDLTKAFATLPELLEMAIE